MYVCMELKSLLIGTCEGKESTQHFVHELYSTFFMCLIGRGGRAHSLLAKILPSLNNTT